MPNRNPLLENAPRILVHARGQMTPSETQFWTRLRHALRARGMELFVLAHHDPQESADVPILRTPNGLSAVPRVKKEHGWRGWMPCSCSWDFEPYLEREVRWNGEASDTAAREARVESLRFFNAFYSAALHLAQPVLTLIWNGYHPQEMILGDLCRNSGCPVYYLERAPIANALHLDPQGILADSAIAQMPTWHWPSAQEQTHWNAVAQRVNAAVVSGDATWWAQPRRQDVAQLRQQYGIRADQQVVLFAGQVDRDTQNLFFSPHFSSNADALRWFCEHLPQDGSVFILGKHHPKNPIPASVYRGLVGLRGVWAEDLALPDAFQLCHRVAAVNSTVLFEGLMRNLPVLALGDSLLCGKGIAYELKTLDDAAGSIGAWLQAENFGAMHARWNDFMAYSIAYAFFTTLPPETAAGQRGADEMAAWIAERAAPASSVRHNFALSPYSFLEEIGLCEDYREGCKRHEGFKEVLRGLHISAHALLGKRSPKAYTGLKHLADALYDRFRK